MEQSELVPADQSVPSVSEPVGKPRKKKMKYSSELKRVQKLERGVSRALLRLAQAQVAGLETWVKARDRSARKRRDGALRDAPKNLARAVSRVLKRGARAPSDFAKASGIKLRPRVAFRLGTRVLIACRIRSRLAPPPFLSGPGRGVLPRPPLLLLAVTRARPRGPLAGIAIRRAAFRSLRRGIAGRRLVRALVSRRMRRGAPLASFGPLRPGRIAMVLGPRIVPVLAFGRRG